MLGNALYKFFLWNGLVRLFSPALMKKKHLLNYGGRVTHVKSVLQSLPVSKPAGRGQPPKKRIFHATVFIWDIWDNKSIYSLCTWPNYIKFVSFTSLRKRITFTPTLIFCLHLSSIILWGQTYYPTIKKLFKYILKLTDSSYSNFNYPITRNLPPITNFKYTLVG